MSNAPVSPSAKPRLVSVVGRYSEAALKALRSLAQNTRVLQSIYLREAIDDLLLKYRGLDCLPPRSPAWPEPYRSTHVMVSVAAKDELDEVHRRHRIQQSELLRDALADLLVKYQAQWRPHEDPPQASSVLVPVLCTGTVGCNSTIFTAMFRHIDGTLWLTCTKCKVRCNKSRWRDGFCSMVFCKATIGCIRSAFTAYLNADDGLLLHCVGCGALQTPGAAVPMGGASSSRPQQPHLALVPGVDK